MGFLKIVILAAIQGAAELLPVSSSAHVIVAERLMGLDPSSPQLTFLLVMLHTGTMFAVLFYFWSRWKKLLQKDARGFVRNLLIATLMTGILGLSLKKGIEKFGHLEVEQLFNLLPLVALNLLVVGIFILVSSRFDRRGVEVHGDEKGGGPPAPTTQDSIVIGLVQAICLPLRGFSRSGATISTALMRGISRTMAEDFSFALAVVLTPPVILLELKRLLHAPTGLGGGDTAFGDISPLASGLIGMFFSFVAGVFALHLLSSLLEGGKWRYFGVYCLVASGVVFTLHMGGL